MNKQINLALNVGTTKAEVEALAQVILNAVQDENPILRFGFLRSLEEACTTATKLVTEDAINEALAKNPDGLSKYPGAADGKDFLVGSDKYRVTIKNEYPYGEQTIPGDNGKRRDDPNAMLWRAEMAVIEKRKEDGKLSTKKLAAYEAQLRADHPRMMPNKTTLSISLRAASR